MLLEPENKEEKIDYVEEFDKDKFYANYYDL